MNDFKDIGVIVVGGTRNIGLAIAETYINFGAKVFIVGGYSEDNLNRALSHLKALSNKIEGCIADMSDDKNVQMVFKSFEQKYNCNPQILINGQGYRPHKKFLEINSEEFNEVIKRNVLGMFLASQEFFRRCNTTGSIVNIGGLSAHKPAKDRAHVITSKAAIIGLTKALAEEGRNKIKVNCIVPGVIETERSIDQPQASFTDEHNFIKGDTSAISQAVISISDLSNIYLTGQTLHVNGGRWMP